MAARIAEKFRQLCPLSCLDPPQDENGNFREITPTVIARAKIRIQNDLRTQAFQTDQRQTMPPTVNNGGEQVSILLRLPRELRDSILEYVVQDEPTPYYLNTTIEHPYNYFINSRRQCTLACRQIFAEYHTLLDKAAASPVAYELRCFREPSNPIYTTIYNVKFERLIAYITSLPPEGRKVFSDPAKLRVSLVFTSLYETRRANLLKWLELCEFLRISASYWIPTYHGKIQMPVLYINIYDLFSIEGTAEEERIFKALQQWYAIRRQTRRPRERISARQCCTTLIDTYPEEVQRAQAKGLRTMKTAEQSLQPVRLAED